MEEAGAPPDVATLNAVLGALHRGRQPDHVQALVAHMQPVGHASRPAASSRPSSGI